MTDSYHGRLASEPDPILARYYERQIHKERASSLEYHLAASEAHVLALAECGVISAEVRGALLRALSDIRDGNGASLPAGGHIDDLCTSIEAGVTRAVGPEVAGWLHTGRSRNDYFMGIVRMQTRDGLLELSESLQDLQAVIIERAAEHAATVFPGYTHHSQQAQPVTFGHFLLAHSEALARDARRLAQAREATDASPFGAAALAGTGFPIDRERIAELLGFSRILVNTADASGSRDFQLQAIAACAILCATLGRLAESLILYTSQEFSYIELDDSICGISSIMPQKKNPVGLELVEVALADNIGRLIATFATLKSTTLGMSEEAASCDSRVSEAIAGAAQAVNLCARAIATLRVKADVALAAVQAGLATATDVTDLLVTECGLPFRQAHSIVGRAISVFLGQRDTCDLADPGQQQELLEALRAEARCVIGRELEIGDGRLLAGLDVGRAVRARAVVGGTAPEELDRMLSHARACRDQTQSEIADVKTAREGWILNLQQAVGGSSTRT